MGAIVSSLFGLLFGTLAAGAWIGISLLATAIGLALIFTGIPVDRLFPQYVFNILTTPDLVALPLFILMGGSSCSGRVLRRPSSLASPPRGRAYFRGGCCM